MPGAEFLAVVQIHLSRLTPESFVPPCHACFLHILRCSLAFLSFLQIDRVTLLRGCTFVPYLYTSTLYSFEGGASLRNVNGLQISCPVLQHQFQAPRNSKDPALHAKVQRSRAGTKARVRSDAARLPYR